MNNTTGVAVTTHNRRAMALESIAALIKRTPEDIPIFVVDDGSDEPFVHRSPRLTIRRNEAPLGIARAKNQCLELLDGFAHMLLLDDDCRPVASTWADFYVQAFKDTGCHHFSLSRIRPTNANKRLADIELGGRTLTTWNWPCGVCQFYSRQAIDTVGGFNPAYGRWGYEHVGLSSRIHNAGLTPARFVDVQGSGDQVRMLDERPGFDRVFDHKFRSEALAKNGPIYMQEIKTRDFIPYRA